MISRHMTAPADQQLITLTVSIGTYSLNVQKKAEYGTLTVSVVQDGKVLDARSTSAPFGTVSLAGTCV